VDDQSPGHLERLGDRGVHRRRGAAERGARTRTYVDIPEQGQQGAPVLALTVKQDGHVETKITGNNDTRRSTYAESISGMPSDATARAGTT
jgi:hypothetical protein